jgi:hypothetical protein
MTIRSTSKDKNQSGEVVVGILWLLVYGGMILASLWPNSEALLVANRSGLF